VASVLQINPIADVIDLIEMQGGPLYRWQIL
jgi:hypothetical protein